MAAHHTDLIRTGCGNMVQCRPITPVTELHGREVNRVEVDVVLAHELIQADVLLVEPPLLPLGGIVGGDACVSDRRVKLDYVCSVLQRNRGGGFVAYPDVCSSR